MPKVGSVIQIREHALCGATGIFLFGSTSSFMSIYVELVKEFHISAEKKVSQKTCE